MTVAHCEFVLRTEIPGGIRYDRVPLVTIDGYSLPTTLVPAVGDLIYLSGRIREGDDPVGIVKIVARDWLFPQYGSMTWPRTNPECVVPSATVNFLVERHEGLYIDEAPREQDDD